MNEFQTSTTLSRGGIKICLLTYIPEKEHIQRTSQIFGNPKNNLTSSAWTYEHLNTFNNMLVTDFKYLNK